MKSLRLFSLLTGFVPAFAGAVCVCPVTTPEEQKDLATYVFNADVWDVQTIKETGKKIITFDIDDTFKGNPTDRVEVVDAHAGTDCALDFKEGESYLVYVRWQWGAKMTSRCWGTKRLEQAVPDAALGPGDAWKAKLYGKMQENCMGRMDTNCCLDSLKALRAGHYLPQTEQGCPDGMIPDRLRCDGSYIWCIPATDTNRHN